ncbi:50S ribosomal protein L25/general stress protein Ctc [Varunaivibrio sulfuroxidans]|uniref:Large ribosomal subunit protein bL25 n=1 Tax=Varunaivibrio sulfuroxidans TaxID=1773489 RepID=A0A4R3J7M1_9PROT|nr:50S ribosomal protein L25/general stress protein Ctc [Varunaivibrio sulfuroxidans]TCS60903.1 large subunit ribosomal protein L25 [Varunaivibrio sulfuroxidans]WES31688.1 50S ribosomal protein L25/general stress protein Ctc [Varunaivibrio sulfuroxidans]
MSDAIVFNAETRERAGKGAARATRRSGRVPAVIYGDKKEPVLISLEPVQLNKEMNRRGFFSHLYDVKVGKDTHKVLVRDLQLDPVTDIPLHVDFMRPSKGEKITVEVTINFINEEDSPGLKYGGVLNVVRHAVELSCVPTAIPESIEIDLAGLEVGDSIHISSVKLPEGAEPTITDRDFTIATIAAPTVSKAADTEEEVTEGEEGEEEAD